MEGDKGKVGEREWGREREGERERVCVWGRAYGLT